MHKNNLMNRWIVGLSATFVMALSGLVPETNYAQITNSANLSVYCGKSDYSLATIVDNRRGRQVILIEWNKVWSSKWTPQQRCLQVSRKFQQNIYSGDLKYIVPGIANGLPVLCASPSKTSGRITCQDANILMTLRPEDSPEGIIFELNEINAARNAKPLSHSYPLDDNYNLDVELWIAYSEDYYGEPYKFVDAGEPSSNSRKYLRQITFVCGRHNGISTTLARTPKLDIPIIIWKSRSFMNSGLTPEQNCQNVSNRFEELRQKNAFNYIISGVGHL